MAMNKREKELVESLRFELAKARAFRFTANVERDLPPPERSGELSLGWDFNHYSKRAYKACSSTIYHGEGWERTSTQNPRSLYSTKLLALQAMRHKMEKEFSETLARVDLMIEEEYDNG